jgi:hypothetical protein
VQGWSAVETSDQKSDIYEAISCIACRQTHLVNSETGDVLTAQEK